MNTEKKERLYSTRLALEVRNTVDGIDAEKSSDRCDAAVSVSTTGERSDSCFVVDLKEAELIV